jgi:hypothetical protein
MTGTIILKQPASALLLSVIANGVTIWQGEFQTVGTFLVEVPIPVTWALTGNVWVNYQVYNGSGIDQGGGGLWEYQLTFYEQ